MPIVRTYGCESCGHFIEVTLTMEQVDDPPPLCPHCAEEASHVQMAQEFKPVAIGGSVTARANRLAEQIASEDYGVADMQRDHRAESTPQVRYKDQGNPIQSAQMSTWGANGAMLEQAIQIGRATRMDPKSGGMSGVDLLHKMIKEGTQPDLIENSKRISPKVW